MFLNNCSCFIADKCSQPAKEAGSCYDYVLRYSYVSSSGDCEPFYYGGCEGNDNRFESADECEAECSGAAITTTRPPARQTERPDDSHEQGWFVIVKMFVQDYIFVSPALLFRTCSTGLQSVVLSLMAVSFTP